MAVTSDWKLRTGARFTGNGDDRDDFPVLGLDRVPAAGETGQIRPGARGGCGNAVASRFHLLFGPTVAPAGKHCVGHVGACRIAGNAHIQPFLADIGNGNDRGPQVEDEIFPHPDLDRGKCRAGSILMRCRQGDHRTVAAEDEGKVTLSDSVQHGGNHRSARHVDVLVAPVTDRLGGADDVGQRQDPSLGQGAVIASIGHTLELGKDRHGSKELIVGSGAHDPTLSQTVVAAATPFQELRQSTSHSFV